jgi:acyl transferase domain-containing protein/acyl carrier protein
MTDKRLTRERIAQLTPKRLTLLALELQEQLDAAQRRGREPVAIVGLACRFPGGANSPEQLWSALREGRDLIGEVPAERWDVDALYDPNPDAPGKMSTRFGGFIDAIDTFDSELFGIAPREAESMDPQQRLLLELSWEALERAGIAPDGLRGSRAGVFVGICNNDYAQLALRRPRESIDAYFASGAAFSVAAGRVAYVLGLEGATMVIDTACSSSLVAIHEACAHLNSGGISLAIAAGVNVICAPDITIALSKAHMMAPDGRCKSFDDSANGFVRAEGCGVLVLKRLDDALRDGDRIHALIRGSAVNQDGRSSGLTVPSGAAQVRVVRDALANAGLEPSAVDYVEAHGTGTSLGDPIEIRALGESLCGGRDSSRPLLVGSVKTNMGHLESAAGVAGLIKAVLAIEHGVIPRHLHLHNPNRDVDWPSLPIRVTTEETPWPRDAARVAGVSSFGFSGTNAHVLVAAPPPPLPRPDAVAERSWHVLPLAAKTQSSLDALVGRYADAVTQPSVADLCYTAAVGRAHLRERAAAVGNSAETLRDGLRGPRLVVARAAARRAAADVEPVFVFTGSGSQWLGMARGLHASAPAFRAAFDECARILEPHFDVPLLDVVTGDDARLSRTRYAQPAVFAVEYALVALWRSWGVEPAAVIGHSLGEYVAACVAGVFSLHDALTLVAERARLIDDLPSGGAMAAVFAPLERVRPLLEQHAGVEVAALNSPENFAISGDEHAVEALLRALHADNVETRRLTVTSAFHSARLEPMLAEFERRAARVAMNPPQLPLVANLTGELWTDGAPDAAYWRAHARQPVRFAEGVRALLARGYRWFVEIGPHPVLLPLVQQCARGMDDVLCVPSLRRGVEDWQPLLESLATLYVHGASIDWAEFHAPYPRRRVAAPTYPFERKRYWLTGVAAGVAAAPSGEPVPNAPLLTRRLAVPVPTFATDLAPTTHPFAYEHRVGGVSLAAVPLFAEIALEAGAALRGGDRAELADLVVRAPLELAAAGTTLHTTVTKRDDGRFTVAIFARPAATGEWLLHAEACYGSAARASFEPIAPERLAALGYTEQSVAEFYERLRHASIELGPAVAGVRRLFRGRDGDVVALLDLAGKVPAAQYTLHPATADAAFQAVGAALAFAPGGDAQTYLLGGIASLVVSSTVGTTAWCRARVSPEQRDRRMGEAVIYDEHGVELAAFHDIAFVRAAAAPARTAATDVVAGFGYALEWSPLPLPPSLRNFGAAAALESAAGIRDAAERAYAAVEPRLALARYDGALAGVDALARQYIVTAFTALGLRGRSHLEPRALFVELGIPARHERLFVRLFEILSDGGLLVSAADGYRWTEVAPLAATPEALARAHPECGAEITMLARCGEQLVGVLRGAIDPVALLFADGGSETLDSLYREAPFARAMNETLAAALRAALAKVPVTRPVRILEIGAGTGGTTAVVLPLLQGRRATYAFTDLSTAFLERAAREFAEHSFMTFQLFDVERELAAQGVAPGSFDVVIAANVVHATRDIAAALRHARELLAPGGALLLVEGTTREPWVDLTFGLTDGWWRFVDSARRPSYPLLDRPAWRAALAETGFVDIALTPNEALGRRGRSQILVSARAGGGAAVPATLGSKRWLIGGGGELAAALLRALPGAATVAESSTAAVDAETVAIFAADAAGEAMATAEAALAFVQDVERAAAQNCRLWFATTGAVPLAGESPNVALAPLWGIGRGFALEQVERWGGLVDLDPQLPAAESMWSLLEQIDGDGEDQVAFRGGRRYAPRLVAAPVPSGGTFVADSAGAYLVTGGLGGLGLALARWLAKAGARNIVLLGRRALPPRASGDPRWQDLDALASEGVAVEVALGDVADRTALQAVLDGVARRGAALRGVFHCAATVNPAELATMTAAELRDALRAKVLGTRLLDELTRALPLDVFVLFSSTTSLLGVRGLAHYAAANQYLDAYAHLRRHAGLPALAVNWGTWEVMRAASAADRETFARGGLLPLPIGAAFEALQRLLASGATQHTVAAVDWPRLKGLYETRRPRPLLALVGGAGAARTAATERPQGAFVERVAGLEPSARRDAIVAEIRAVVADVLRLDSARLRDLREGFFDLGMDSLMAVELRNRLETSFGIGLPSTLTFNYPNIEAVAKFVEGRIVAGTATPQSKAAAVEPARPARPPAPVGAAPTGAADSVEQRLAAKLRALGYE